MGRRAAHAAAGDRVRRCAYGARWLDWIELVVLVIAALTITIALWLHHAGGWACRGSDPARPILMSKQIAAPELHSQDQAYSARPCEQPRSLPGVQRREP